MSREANKYSVSLRSRLILVMELLTTLGAHLVEVRTDGDPRVSGSLESDRERPEESHRVPPLLGPSFRTSPTRTRVSHTGQGRHRKSRGPNVEVKVTSSFFDSGRSWHRSPATRPLSRSARNLCLLPGGPSVPPTSVVSDRATGRTALVPLGRPSVLLGTPPRPLREAGQESRLA